ncbi:diphosphomevalonate/mevalonate 3,5-bisphosphate decarboxylase family protein [Carboxylicivirga sp. N1Y90]|uniref:diphosphomevalonate/mevalonate 3,5-bisphosphate decarboxylase family protein n=1 Tax=Carboxylicivirga fragile TaxID=3417571 RepID=UPI003D350B4F|nr:diphosphomevalonate decarboxylase [Marinilabiliaceae bacterium N1Y90]
MNKVYQEAPSNIAIVKYWGKKGIQEPMNASLSFTMSKSISKIEIQHAHSEEELKIDFLFDGQKKDSFLPKIQDFIKRNEKHLSNITSGILKINSSNTFPHSSGIASSASSMAALAKGLYSINQSIGNEQEYNPQVVSEMARLGSGSASRSTQTGWVLWGKTDELQGSSDHYGIEINNQIHENFHSLQDSILVIRKGAKSVSSTVGHQLMDNHPFKEGRLKQANKNIKKLISALKQGDFKIFTEVCEEEAMSLHALMMSSSPGYTLMAPETLRAIKRINKFRDSNHVPLTYTLDAGPNIHLIYPKEQSKIVHPFIKEHLAPLCEDESVIYDEISMPLQQ